MEEKTAARQPPFFTVMRQPVVVIVGRPNVGKSSLFNRLIGRRVAIVEPLPGLTRDRLYATATWAGREFALADTGGFVSAAHDPILVQVRKQVERAMDEADVILFVVDAQSGLLPEDREIAQWLRQARRPVLLVANKVDDPRHAGAFEFYELGLGDPIAISAIHGLGIGDLCDGIVAMVPESEPTAEPMAATHVAIVGRPNVGKSSLVNAILGEERVIVDAAPGTTRDAVDTALTRDGRRFVLIDTAGLRRKARIDHAVERYSADRALRAIDRADVVVLVVDATGPIADQDQEIARYTQEQGRALVLAANKWDQLADTDRVHPSSLAPVREAMRFVAYASIVVASAKQGWGIAALINEVAKAAEAHGRRIGTGPLNRAVELAEQAHQSPTDPHGRQLKIYYATQAQTNPPTIVFFVNDPALMPATYRRYLESQLRAAFDFHGTPIRLIARPRGRAKSSP